MTPFDKFTKKNLSIIERYFRYISLSIHYSIYNDETRIKNTKNIISDEEKELVNDYLKSEGLFISFIDTQIISNYRNIVKFRTKVDKNIFRRALI